MKDYMKKAEQMAYYDGIATGLQAGLSILTTIYQDKTGIFGWRKRKRNIELAIKTISDMLYELEAQVNRL